MLGKSESIRRYERIEVDDWGRISVGVSHSGEEVELIELESGKTLIGIVQEDDE